MEIRRATVDDAVALVDDRWLPMAREMAELDKYNALADDVRDDAIEYRRETLAQPEYCIRIAIEDGAFVGFASAEVTPSPPVFDRGADLGINELSVRPERRRRGIATELLDAVTRGPLRAVDRHSGGCDTGGCTKLT